MVGLQYFLAERYRPSTAGKEARIQLESLSTVASHGLLGILLLRDAWAYTSNHSRDLG